jgi:hypothetical protein
MLRTLATAASDLGYSDQRERQSVLVSERRRDVAQQQILASAGEIRALASP